MNIALIAHDAKKELMVQFCIAYCGILSRHNLCATGTTGKMVAEATGLQITRYMSGSQGGDQQIAARIACELSGAGSVPSALANISAASNTLVCSTLTASIYPS